MRSVSESMIMETEKLILDACCGSRMFWFDKQNPNVLFVDKRSETVTAKDRDKVRTIEVKPDIVADFTNLPFEDNSFDSIICSNSFHHYPNPQAFFDSVGILYIGGADYGRESEEML